MHPSCSMKSRFAAALPGLLLGLLLAIGLPASAEQWPADAYVLQVDGLACPYCGYGVEKQFAKREGVQATDIDIEKGVVIVSVAQRTRFSDSELEQHVHDAGFELGRIIHRPTNN